ncbi:DNA/RNA non-specific endonuclease [Winogradskyella thalassocola]|uniref:DNA/RNA non-specific endonuclease n=1 Tax=Winogradskyella thalassocola TaxID=262004 RepID=A0A1G7ZPH5_9FLAO|nr:DNA/RNA non-specific endonuclease [Winogradskyella thalassocola]SDH10578.1 DNA/RNA non-specific endonuclease [Winogradskyella thalassocola]
MNNYIIRPLLLILLFSLVSCNKIGKKIIKEKELIELFSKNEDVLAILKVDFPDDLIRGFHKNLDEASLKQLAKQIEGSKELGSYLKVNPKAIKAWGFLSNSNYAKDVEIIKYFDELPTSKFSLKSNNRIGEIYDVSSGGLLAKLDNKSILITKLDNNAFANLNKFAPNTIYKVKNIDYQIDDIGRVVSAKTSLLKLDNSIPSNSLISEEFNQIISSVFGGTNLKLNQVFVDKDIFSQLNNTWLDALKKREKIGRINIKSIFNSNQKTPDAFNVIYYNGKDRIPIHIENTLKKQNDDVFKKLQRSAEGTYINGKTAIENFPKDITLNGNKLIFEGKPFGVIDPKTSTVTIDRRAALNKKSINPLLDHPRLLEDFKYVVKDGKNTHIYKTDNLGRVIESQHTIISKTSKNRNVVSQNKAKLYGDEVSSKTSLENLTNNQHKRMSDEGGHYLADSAGGIPESINITSQAYKVNHSKKWRAMEDKITKAIENGDNVLVKNTQIFSDNSRRSSGAIYEISINGKIEKLEFNNINNTLEVI